MNEESRKHIAFLTAMSAPPPIPSGPQTITRPQLQSLIKAFLQLQVRITFLTETVEKQGYTAAQGVAQMIKDAETNPKVEEALARASTTAAAWEKAWQADLELITDAIESGALPFPSLPQAACASLQNGTPLIDEIRRMK